MKPLDIVTTAGSNGDVIAALQTLPGTQPNAEDGRLFVRGGDARETKIYIDGLRVFTPYSRTVSGTPVRGRYSPFLFKGVSFSTGGYSSAYGQALSGILDMNTIDDPQQTQTDISLMTVGVGLGHTKKWDDQSLSLSTSYIDLSPYYQFINTRVDLKEPYRGFSGESVYRNKIGGGLLKSYLAGDFTRVRVGQFDLDAQRDLNIEIDNYNVYSNTSYNKVLNDKNSVMTGVSIGVNRDHAAIDSFELDTDLNGVNGRLAFKSLINDHFILNYGADVMYQEDVLTKSLTGTDFSIDDKVGRFISATFVESDYFLSKDLAFKLGLRAEHHSLFDQIQLSPRLTLAQKLSKNSQVSFALGQFTQEVESSYLFYDNDLINEKSYHALANYNIKTDKQIFRFETYYKKYDGLTKYSSVFNGNENVLSDFSNTGEGESYGIDMFWRATGLIKNLDFWLSYGYLVNERNFKDYPVTATPPFSTSHNLSVVGKRWFEGLKSQWSFTYQVSSGRPYENPNTDGFLNERSKSFHNMSMSWAYLISQQKILFASVSNFPGFKNEFGYRYANEPDISGIYPGEIIRPNEDRFFFVGFFMTISEDKTENQLDNL